jgi:hypothetical protein
MAKHQGQHAQKALVNAKLGTNSTLVLNTDFDLTKFDVKGDVTDDNATQGHWKAKRVHAKTNDDPAKELRLLLTCTTEPHKEKEADDPPTAGTLTITLTDGSTDQTVAQAAAYANDPPP